MDEGLDKILIFCDIIWVLLCEDGVFKLGDFVFETRFPRGVGFTLAITGSSLASTSP